VHETTARYRCNTAAPKRTIGVMLLIWVVREMTEQRRKVGKKEAFVSLLTAKEFWMPLDLIIKMAVTRILGLCLIELVKCSRAREIRQMSVFWWLKMKT